MFGIRKPASVYAPAILLLSLLAPPAHAQRIEGHVEWLGWSDASTATVHLLDSTLSVVDSTQTSAGGAFSFDDLRPGTWFVQAMSQGESSPVSDAFQLASPADTLRLLLPIASPLFTLATQCPATPSDVPAAVLVGVAYERLARAPLVGTDVRLLWSQPGDTIERVAETRTDARGQYRFCGVPADLSMRMAVVAFGRTTLLGDAVRVEADAIHRQDLSVAAFSEVGALTSIVVVSSEPLDRAEAHSRVSGRLVDAVTNGAIPGAEVGIAETDLVTLSDAAGRFQLDSVPAQLHDVLVSRLGYSEQRLSLEVPVARMLEVEIRLGAEAVQLAGIDVDVRRPLLFGLDERSNRVVSGASLAAYEQRGAHFEDIARDRFPLHVSIRRGSLCLESRREVRFQRRGTSAGCAMVPVYVDDVQVYGASDYLYSMRADEIESAIYLSPGEAGLKYGLASQSRGVLLIYTRGHGPFRSPLRNVR